VKCGGCPYNSCGAFGSRTGNQEVVELSDEEEVAEGVCSELHVVPLCGVLVLGRTRCIGDTKEGVEGGFLPAVVETGSVSEADTFGDRWLT